MIKKIYTHIRICRYFSLCIRAHIWHTVEVALETRQCVTAIEPSARVDPPHLISSIFGDRDRR